METDAIRVVIADDEPITRMDLRELLIVGGYSVVGEAADGFDAVEVCRQFKPHLVLMDIKMPLLDGISASSIIADEGLATTIILLTAYSEREFVEKAKSVGINGYLVKPIDEKSLIPSIELTMARSKDLGQLRRDITKATERLENRSMIEKAKGLIMQRQGLSEQDAYDYIRRLSQSKKLSMRRIAEIIIQAKGT